MVVRTWNLPGGPREVEASLACNRALQAGLGPE